MESLRASYGSDSDSDGPPRSSEKKRMAPRPTSNPKETIRLPPPPVDLLQPQNSLGKFCLSCLNYKFQSRLRNAVQILRLAKETVLGASHMFKETMHYIFSSQNDRGKHLQHLQKSRDFCMRPSIYVRIPCLTRKQLASYMKIISSLVPDLYVIDVDIALNELCKDEEKFEQVILGREFHISLGRPVPIRVHQIDSILAMLSQRLQFQRRYWMEFNKWEVFVNDELTRSFLSLEVTGGGLVEITRQICIVDEIYRLHGLPEFYKNPRPHISLVWALGDVTNRLKPAAEELNKFSNRTSSCRNHVFTTKFSGIECRIGKKLYTICKLPD